MSKPLARAGMNLAQLEHMYDHLQRRYLDPGKIAGFVPLVYRRGEIVSFRPWAAWIWKTASPWLRIASSGFIP